MRFSEELEIVQRIIQRDTIHLIQISRKFHTA